MRFIKVQVIIDFVPDSSLKPVFGFCRSVRSKFSLAVFVFVSQLSSTLSALSPLVSGSKCAQTCRPPQAACLFYCVYCVVFHLCTTALVGSNTFNTRNTFNRLLLFKRVCACVRARMHACVCVCVSC